MTSFVGRERERLSIEQLMDSTRLVTITGPGGVGKTRLALEVAHARTPLFRDGVWLIELAMLSASNLVVYAVAEACGVGERKGQPILVRLLEWLGE
jgi:predicted ATPase